VQLPVAVLDLKIEVL